MKKTIAILLMLVLAFSLVFAQGAKESTVVKEVENAVEEIVARFRTESMKRGRRAGQILFMGIDLWPVQMFFSEKHGFPVDSPKNRRSFQNI